MPTLAPEAGARRGGAAGQAVRGWVVPTLALALALLIALPLLLNPFLPFEDLPNHIARRHLAAGVPAPLAEYVVLQGGLATNAAVDLAWQLRLWLGPVTAQDALAFSRGAMAVAMLGLVGAVMVLHRVLHGRWSAWPLLAGLLVHNANVLWGFENYVVTLPLGILGLALWIATRGAAPALRLGLTLAVAVVLFLGHVLVLLAYAVLVAGYEAGRTWRPGGRPDWAAADWAGLAVVAGVCLVYVAQSAAAPPAGYGTTTDLGPLSARLQILLSPFGAGMGADALLGVLGAQAPVLLAVPVVLWVLVRRGLLVARGAPGMAAPLVLLALVALAMPVQLSGVYFTHLRFPVLLFALLIAATDLRPAPGRWPALVGGVLALALLGAVALRSQALDRAARAHSAEVAALSSLAADLPAGARVLPVLAPGLRPATTRHFHTAAYLVPLADVLVPTLFVGGSHRLAMAPGLTGLSAPQPSAVPLPLLDLPPEGWSEAMREAWAFVPGWRGRFTHLLLIGPAPEGFAARDDLQPLRQAGEIGLYRIRAAGG